jgi:hypothetical protein
MESAVDAKRVTWPALTGTELADIAAYLAGGATAAAR